ncbi:HtrA protease/chaperone protein [hydrothermal vent metagenome]|uniref:Probable periplasmic serine endoprotease DegP-like n=1 Tax=hydrothermal vent metagenome TaxID=652676 RepID=A0A3B1CMA5_9ZZZZ
MKYSNNIKWFALGPVILTLGVFIGSHYKEPSIQLGPSVARAAKIDPQNVFVKIAREQTPAVVNISTKQKIKADGRAGIPDERMREYYDRFFPWHREAPREQVRQSLGSGFVVESDGYILTNSHVVAKADEIIVSFGDGHDTRAKEYPAKLIAADPKTDIALIKIDVSRKLPTISLGDSSKLQVGEQVMAIGNPFGFAQSVTVGVVSAKGRVIGAGPYDDFIQTDASINPGNSGGPLLNTRGEVVGINSAIYTGGMARGNIGIGFAIPIDSVKAIYDDLKKGKVKRGWLGVAITNVTKELQDAMGLPDSKGALVSQVIENSPAEKSGVKRYDVITGLNGEKVLSSSHLPRIVAAIKPGTKAVLEIIRDGKTISISVNVGEMPTERKRLAESKRNEDLGMAVENIPAQLAERMGIEGGAGVVVTSVAPGSPAGTAGAIAGDVIMEMNKKKVRNIQEYESAISSAKPGDSLLMLVRRGRNDLLLVLKLPKEK